MKIIENWEVKEYINGEERTGIPMPGCIIYGDVEGENKRIEVLDINLSKLTCIDIYEEEYLLQGARTEYLNVLETAMKYYARQEMNKSDEGR